MHLIHDCSCLPIVWLLFYCDACGQMVGGEGLEEGVGFFVWSVRLISIGLVIVGMYVMIGPMNV